MPRLPRLAWQLQAVPPRLGRPSPPEMPTQQPPRLEGPVPTPSEAARSTASIRGLPPSRMVRRLLLLLRAAETAMLILPTMTMDMAMTLPTRSRNLRWTRQALMRRDSTKVTELHLSRSPHMALQLFPMSNTASTREVWPMEVPLWTMASWTTKRVLPLLWL